jgi:hypothetical protein
MASRPIDHLAATGVSQRTLLKGLDAAGLATGIVAGSAQDELVHVPTMEPHSVITEAK